MQDKVSKGGIDIRRAKGEDNVAYGPTKDVERVNMDKYMAKCGPRFAVGRDPRCPALGDWLAALGIVRFRFVSLPLIY